MKGFGTKITYQLFAATMVLTGCMYYVFNKVFIVPLEKNKLALEAANCTKKKVKHMVIKFIRKSYTTIVSYLGIGLLIDRFYMVSIIFRRYFI